MIILLLVFISEIKIDLTLKNRFLFHRMNTKSSIFTSGGAKSDNITFGVHQ